MAALQLGRGQGGSAAFVPLDKGFHCRLQVASLPSARCLPAGNRYTCYKGRISYLGAGTDGFAEEQERKGLIAQGRGASPSPTL